MHHKPWEENKAVLCRGGDCFVEAGCNEFISLQAVTKAKFRRHVGNQPTLQVPNISIRTGIFALF